MAVASRLPTALQSHQRDSLVGALLTLVVGATAVAIAFVATERLSSQSPVIAGALALLVVLPAWMAFSSKYAVTLAALLLYLGLVDGVLKLKLNTPAATLGRDLLLYSIVFGALARFALAGRRTRLPPLAGYVLAFVVIVLIQVLNPRTGGIVRGLGAIRPHLEFVPLFFLGFAVMRNARRLRLFLVLLCVLAAANGVVSLVQFNLTPEQLASWGPGYSDRIYGRNVAGRVFYDNSGGTAFVRPFGLGPDTGFGGIMGVLAVPALLALVATARKRWLGRIAAPLGIGIVLAVATSQTRTAVLAAVVALLAFGALAMTSRRRAMALVAIAGLVTLTVWLISALGQSENSAALQRYNSIAPSKVLETTFQSRGGTFALIPRYVRDFPLGAGLGQVGPGSSYGLSSREIGEEPLNGESEFTFLLVELGIAGLLILGALTVRLLALAGRIRKLPNGEVRLLLAGCAAPLFGLAANWVTGPVSSGTPASPFFWFVAGVLAFWLRPGVDELGHHARDQPRRGARPQPAPLAV